MKHGFSFDVAFSLNDDMRGAFNLICGELDGGTWNWDAMGWEQRDG